MGADRMTGEYNLSWHQFVDHLRLLSQQFYQEGQYSDVTLVSDDQTQFKAHKIVLNACSPVFKKIIDNNPSQHPLIYLRGIQSYELESILQFMYLGEGRCNYERMGEFIKVAKELEVKDISDGVDMENDAEKTVDNEVVGAGERLEAAGEEIEELAEALTDAAPEYEAEKTSLINVEKEVTKPKDLFSNTTSTQCPECDVVFTKRLYMFRHYKRKHEDIRSPCNQCDYKANTKHHLIIHMESQHEGIKYPCNYCDHQATRKNHLKTHVQTKHGDIIKKGLNGKLVEEKHSDKEAVVDVNQGKTKAKKSNKSDGQYKKELFVKCTDCEGVFASRGLMLKHHEARHEVNLGDLIMSCDHCDYQTK